MSIARKILENTFVQILGKLITAALSMVILKIISRYLGTSGYGDYTTVYQYLAFFGIIADFGIYTITVKEMSRDQTRIPVILGNVMGLRTLLVIFAMLLAVATVFFLPVYKGTLIPMGVLIATFATFFTILNGTISAVLQVHLKMQFATISLVIGKVASVAYMLWAVYAFSHNPESGFYQLLWSGVVGKDATDRRFSRKFNELDLSSHLSPIFLHSADRPSQESRMKPLNISLRPPKNAPPSGVIIDQPAFRSVETACRFRHRLRWLSFTARRPQEPRRSSRLQNHELHQPLASRASDIFASCTTPGPCGASASARS